jgi:hypothetical protein
MPCPAATYRHWSAADRRLTDPFPPIAHHSSVAVTAPRFPPLPDSWLAEESNRHLECPAFLKNVGACKGELHGSMTRRREV